MRRLRLLLLPALWIALSAAAPPSMTPELPGIRLPGRGFVNAEGKPASKPAGLTWSRRRAGSVELWVGLEGPSGSGHFWTVVVGTGKPGRAQPARGVILDTMTSGWKTLGSFHDRALPWVEDVDRDGKPEFVLWEDFPLDSVGIMNGLIARVYRLVTPDSLSYDRDGSRAMARQIAQAYREPTRDDLLRPFRAVAAESLQAFADGRAGVRSP